MVLGARQGHAWDARAGERLAPQGCVQLLVADADDELVSRVLLADGRPLLDQGGQLRVELGLLRGEQGLDGGGVRALRGQHRRCGAQMLRTTGHAVRATGDAPGVSPTNFYLEAGPHAPEAIVGSVSRGLYVTELIGMGVNGVTGDYSRGASGFWIENGELDRKSVV